MKRLKYSFKNIFGFAALSSMVLAGCTDDVIPGGEAGYVDDFRGAVIYVPNVAGHVQGGATRSEGALTDPNDDEKNIHNLYLFAYPVEGKSGEKKVIKLSDLTKISDTSKPSDLKDYTGYELELADGTYKMYIAANVNFPTADVTTETMISEDNLKIYQPVIPATETVLKRDGLPMSCKNTELDLKYSDETSFHDATDGNGIEVSASKGVVIRADLSFSVAKVRVTLLNDIFPTKLITSTSITNVPAKADLFTESGNQPNLASGAFVKSGYSAWGDIENNDDPLEVAVDNLTLSATAPNTGYIWQGVTYVGEYLFDETDTSVTKPEIKLNFSDGSDKPLNPGSSDQKGLKRSFFYDYVGTPLTEFKVQVQQWNPVTIMGALHGAYYLHVDNTQFEKAVSGEPIAIWFDSNATPTLDSETFEKNGTSYKIYTSKIENDTIYVSLNSRLTNGDETRVGDRYQHFTLTAGTITKQFSVGSIDLKQYLDVDKESEEINVRSIITSGNYSGETSVLVTSNLSKVKISKETDTWNLTNIDQALELTEGEYDVVDGEVRVPIKYKNLNSNTFWNDMNTVSFTVSDPAGVVESKTVNVTIYPATEDYTIYAYAPTWDATHVYIYQCLKLPSTLGATANAPVGDGDGNAALEYSFTGGLAFRGWGVKGKDNVDSNDPSEHMTKAGNFYVFDGTGATTTNSWKPSDANENHYYLIDFYSTHRGTIENCKCGTTIDRGFPGIKMTKVNSDQHPGNGWWKITLTGIAKPGQALLMFQDAYTENNEHKWNEQKRYPAGGKPGIPLFDYPNKIGYINLTDAQPAFMNEKPEITNNSVRLYVYDTEAKGGLNIWPGSGSSDASMTKDNSSVIPLYYYDVPKNTDVYVKWTGGEKKFNISTDTYGNLTDNTTGKLPTTSPGSGVRRVFFNNTGDWNGVQAYCWQNSNNSNKNAEWNDAPGATQVKGKIYYYDISNSTWDRIIFKSKNSVTQTGDCNINTSVLYDKDSNSTSY